MKTLVASFGTEAGLADALPHLRELGWIETYTPKALEDDQPSILPLIVLIAGFAGAAASFGMETYANAVAYPVDIGGRPEFSWPAFVPVAFEIGVLAAMLAGFIAFLVVNRMPRLYDPVDESIVMRGATRDRWCVEIRTETPERAHELLRSLAVDQVEELS